MILVLMLMACSGAPTSGPSSSAPTPSDAAPAEVDVAWLAANRASVLVLVDVRTPAEFAGGHVPGAVNMPLSDLETRMDELDPSTDVHVICQSGGRSSRAAEMLRARGFTAVNVAGGTGAWTAAGHPTE